MQIFDPLTVLTMYLLLSALCTAMLGSLWLRNRRIFPGMGLWVADLACMTTGILLIALRGRIPDLISIVVANLVIYSGMVLLLRGLQLYVGKPASQWHNVIYLAGFTVVQSYYTYVDPNLAARNVLGSVTTIFILGQCAFLMLRRVGTDLRESTRPVGMVLALLAVPSSIRIFVDVWQHPVNSIFDSPWTDSVIMLCGQLLMVALTFTLTLAVNSRLRQSLEDDIRRRETAEKALRKSEQKFSVAFQTIPDAVIITLLDTGEIIEVNESFAGVVGHAKETVLGRSTLDVGMWARPSDRDRFVEMLERDGSVSRIDAEFRRDDGTTFSAELSAEILELDGATCALSVVRNVEDEQRAKRELVERTEELLRSNRDLEQFAYVASHDLQEPLRMVTNYTQLLQRRYQGQLDSDADEFMAFILDGAHRMKALIEELLAYARVGTQGRPLARASLDVVLDGVMRALDASIKERGATITADELPVAVCDATQIGQVLQNLIGNALKFRSEDAPRVHVGSRFDNGTWVISVTDNGIGIDPQHFEQIFQIYRRLNSREQYPGTGMGLAICQRIVERHGQRVWVESEPGAGATFCFTLEAETA